ncbi:hypothetical protein ACFOHS_17455 [Jhaorihella thermophila]
MPDRGAGQGPDEYRRRPHGHRRSGGRGTLPERAGPALRRLLSRLPCDRRGDHAGASAQPPARAITRSSCRRFTPTPAPAAASAKKSCVLPEAAIKVLPARLARAEAAEHYRLGWEEKEKAGGPLVEGITDLPDRLPGPGTDNLETPGGFEPAFKVPGARP